MGISDAAGDRGHGVGLQRTAIAGLALEDFRIEGDGIVASWGRGVRSGSCTGGGNCGLQRGTRREPRALPLSARKGGKLIACGGIIDEAVAMILGR